MAIVVSDTSPIRALARLGMVDLLPRLYERVLVPPAVAQELAAVSVELPDTPEFETRLPVNQQLVRRLGTSLDPGESEAIALAVESDAELLLIDEARGREVALTLGVEIRGVLGVLIDAKAAGHVSAVSPLMNRLRSELGFFVSERIASEVLRIAGEGDESQA